jgi:hypothetical protein
MRKYYLCIILLFTVATISLNPATVTEKSFMRTRTPGTGLSMNPYKSGTKGLSSSRNEGVSVQVAPFYQWSRNPKELGKYFGMKNETTGNVDDYIGVDTDNGNELGNSRDFIHNIDASGTRLKDQVQLRPKRKSFGARIDFCADLGEDKNIQIRIGAPILRVETSMQATSILASSTEGILRGMSGKTASLLDFLNGSAQNSSSDNKQNTLEKMKILPGYKTKSGISDVEWAAAFPLSSNDNGTLCASLVGTIPVAETTTGNYFFEPVLGNGKHTAFGGGLSGRIFFTEKYNKKITLFFDAEYRHFFKSNEVRSPFYLQPSGTLLAWPLFSLVGENGTKNGVTPMANFITKEYSVTPGALFEGLLGINISGKTTSLSISYNLYAQQKEKVELGTWSDGTYAIANYSYNTSNAFTPGATNGQAFSGGISSNKNPEHFIDTKELALENAATPLQHVHRACLSISHKWDDESKLFSGIGGFFDFYAKDNSALKDIGFWFRLGINF